MSRDKRIDEPPDSIPLLASGIESQLEQNFQASSGSPDLPISVRWQDFHIGERIGTGGFGEVFEARKKASPPEPEGTLQSTPSFAIKRLKQELWGSTGAQQLFQRTLLLQLRIESFLKRNALDAVARPGIVPILDIGKTSDFTFFTMPLMPGKSFAKRIRNAKKTPITLEEFIRIALQITRALAHTHQINVIHRDIKPDNILLDADGNAYLSDYSCATEIFDDSVPNTFAPRIIGTAPYLSPQAAKGDALDTRSDIYSVGAVFYEMLTGQPPYHGCPNSIIAQTIQSEAPRSIYDIDGRAIPELVAITEGAMAREYRDRYATLSELERDLERIKNGRKPLGPHPKASSMATSNRRPKKWHTRIKGFLGMAACIGLCVGSAFWISRQGKLRVLRMISPPGSVAHFGLAQVAEFNNDLSPEVVLAKNNDLFVTFLTGEHEQTEFILPAGATYPSILTDFVDLEGDGIDEFFFQYRSNGKLFLEIRNLNQASLARFVVTGSFADHERRIGEDDSTRFASAQIADLEGDGIKECLAIVRTGHRLQPRGIICLDLETGNERWFYNTGPQADTLTLYDLDQDGTLEVLFGASSVNNGSVGRDGLADNASYIIALNAAGEQLWAHHTGDELTYPSPLLADLTGDSHPELVYTVGTANGRIWNPETPSHKSANSSLQGALGILDSQGNQQTYFSLTNPPRSINAGNLDDDPKDEIVISLLNGEIIVLEDDLKERQRLRLTQMAPPNRSDETHIFIDHIEDLDGDGKAEIVLRVTELEIHYLNLESDSARPSSQFTYHYPRVVVLGNNLKTRWSFIVTEQSKIGYPVQTAIITNTPHQLLLLSDKIYHLEIP